MAERWRNDFDKLKRHLDGAPDERFFQAISNCFGFAFLGTAEDPSGKNFRDLWHREGDRHEVKQTPYEHDHCWECCRKEHGVTNDMENNQRFQVEMSCNTGMVGKCKFCDKDNALLVYCTDVERAKRAAMGERISSAEFD